MSAILEDNPVATRVGVAVNMVNFGPSLAAGAGPTGIKGTVCLQSYTIRAKELVS